MTAGSADLGAKVVRRQGGWLSQISALVVILAICYGAAFLGQLATAPSVPTWYAGLAKPAFNLPNAVFPIAWGVLYTAMAIAAWLVWRAPDVSGRVPALVTFAVQLGLNVLWSFAFFGAQSPLLGLLVIVPLTVAIAITTFLFFQVSRPAGFIMLPYLAWVAFANALNIAIFILN